MKLNEAFNIARGDVVAFVGAGGKTSTLVGLGYELADAGWRVLATTTTRIGEDQLGLMPHAIALSDRAQIAAALTEHRFVFLYDEIRGGKVYGPSPDHIAWMLDSLDADVLLIEADGARGLPFKAPLPHEPVIPAETTLVVPVASMSVLGKPLNAEHVYNPQAMIERYGFYAESPVKSPWVAQVLRDDELGLKRVPAKARVIAFLNQTPASGYVRARARLTARLTLRSPRVYGVAIGSVRGITPVYEVQRRVGALVLGAGMSRRMGELKLLLPWTHGKTIIEHIIEQLLLARVDHITVVTGHMADEVRKRVEPLGVEVVFNPVYATGEMLSSVKAGLNTMPAHMAAAMVVLGDQPRIQPRIVGQVMAAYAEGAGEIIAPSYQMRRGHPILIDRRYWREILNLPDHAAPRDVINAHPERTAYVNVDTDSVLRDVDTPDDYRDERWRAGLND
jgi:molybdenum cofactor cytidylyltransferase